jgi:hypothetical protein
LCQPSIFGRRDTVIVRTGFGGGFAAELTVVKPAVPVQILLLRRGDRAAVTVDARAVLDQVFGEGRLDYGFVQACPGERDEGCGRAEQAGPHSDKGRNPGVAAGEDLLHGPDFVTVRVRDDASVEDDVVDLLQAGHHAHP